MNSILRNHSPASGPATSRRHVLLIGIDGARWDIVAETGVGTRLQELAREGSWHTMVMEPPTWSGPGWSSILTGSVHAEHGVTDNSCVGSKLWLRPDFLSEAFYRDHSTRTFAAASWPVLIDPHGLGPIIHPRREQQYAGLHNILVRDGETYGYVHVDAEIAAATAAKLNRDNGGFDVGFCYFCNIDDAGHVHGLRSAEYRDAVRRVDKHVATVVDQVTRRHTDFGEDWLVVVTTDHGHRDEGGHGGDSDRERESWVIAFSPGGDVPEWPEEIRPQDLAGLMLAERER